MREREREIRRNYDDIGNCVTLVTILSFFFFFEGNNFEFVILEDVEKVIDYFEMKNGNGESCFLVDI